MDQTTKKDFSKKAITQLCAISELGLLLSLSNGQIRIHTLATLKELAYLKNQKDAPLKQCSCFALKKHKGELVMVIGRKKVLTLMSYDHKLMTFTFKQEFLLPDIPKSLVWCGTSICVGFKREYSLINLEKNGSQTSLFSAGASQNYTIGISLPDEIILARENIGIPLNLEGKPTRPYGIVWTEMPSTIGYLKPFVVAPCTNYIELRTLDAERSGGKKETLVQTLSIANVVAISQPNFINIDEGLLDYGRGIGMKEREELFDKNDDLIPHYRMFLAQKNDIYVMSMRQIYLQVNELRVKREYEFAMRMIDFFKDTMYAVDRIRVNTVYLDFGFDLFADSDFEVAMDHFSKTQDDPRMILALYPDLLSLSGNFSQILPLSPPQLTKIKNIMNDPKRKHAAFKALIPFLEKRRLPADENISTDQYPIAEAIDTAILKAMLFTNDENVISFLENPNRCNIQESENILHHFKKLSELVLFYKSKDLHEKALLLLKREGDKPESEDDSLYMRGVKPTVEYLKDLEGHSEIILNYARWVLKKDPMYGLKIFYSENNPFPNPLEVLKYFESVKGGKILSMKISYLEHLVSVEKVEDPELHNMLVVYYQQFLTSSSKNDEMFGTDDIRKKLKGFLTSSQYYVPEKILTKFVNHEGKFLEERAILLSRINQHEQALNILVHELNRFESAEKYCVQHYDPNNEKSKDIFLVFLKMTLAPPVPHPPNINQAISILEKYHDRINVIDALHLLPDDIKLKKLGKFLESVFRKQLEQTRQSQILKNLSKSENTQFQIQSVGEKQRSVKIKFGRTCKVCNKAIGLSAFACYPNNVVVHYVCCKNQNICPITHKNFLEDHRFEN